MDSTLSSTRPLEKPVSLIWGCELNDQNKTFVFKVTDEEKCEHQLALRTVCLGEKAKDEFHIVEIVPQEGSEDKPVTIATLKPSILPMATMFGLELTPPVTFRLKAGSGPLFISGQHVALEEDSAWSAPEEEMEEEDIEEEEEEDAESPPKAAKRPAATKKGAQAKKKLDKEESSDEDSPLKKGKVAGRGRKPAKK
uniref:Nucleoplasmin n=1 Tax=Leptobrachium leishanense TaxID=445787 RepID=A0A8C5WEJ6_9ANUR